jgi:hypothetical protein
MLKLLIIFLFIMLVIKLMPLILGTVALFIFVGALLVLLARFGLFPGVTFRRYKTDNRSNERWFHPEEEERKYEKNSNDCHNSFQEGEEVTLPGTALHKENDSKEKTE